MLASATRTDSRAPARAYADHAESHVYLKAPADRVFGHLDRHERLAAHMERRTWRMGWGRMTLRADSQEGRAVGSRIRLAGRVFGVRLWLEEEVVERVPPTRKVWETVGPLRLLVIGHYRMGLVLAPGTVPGAVLLSVFIDYVLPSRGASWLLGRLFGHWYARWCTARMTADAEAGFGAVAPEGAARGEPLRPST